jgi:DNA-binding transcriptional regulator YhcF (GntR family)
VLISLDLQADIPIYVQLRAQIVEGIATGQLKPGDALPSVRQLAEDIGINMHTVNKTYNILKQDGFLLVHRQKGVVVNPDMLPRVTKEYVQQIHNDLRPMIVEAYCRGMTKKEFTQMCKDIFEDLKKGEAKS